MENKKLLDIIKELNDNRSKLSALYSLYNNSLIVAEESRQSLSVYYEQMIDMKNDLCMITNNISSAKKSEREAVFNRHSAKIKKINVDVKAISDDFMSDTSKYRIALKDCGSLKTEYKHRISELCKEFKANVTDDLDPIIIKGYKQQVKIIKAILDKIELLISDYNVKKNKVEDDNVKFTLLYESVSSLISKLQSA